MFDKLVLLAQGQVIFFGTIEGFLFNAFANAYPIITDSISYFSKVGYPVPARTNPSDQIGAR